MPPIRLERTRHSTLSLHLSGAPAPADGTTIYFECADRDEQAARMQADGFVFDH